MEPARYNELFGAVMHTLCMAGVPDDVAARAAEAAAKKVAGFDPQRDLNWSEAVEYRTSDLTRAC